MAMQERRAFLRRQGAEAFPGVFVAVYALHNIISITVFYKNSADVPI
jgi:hypothetical protein